MNYDSYLLASPCYQILYYHLSTNSVDLKLKVIPTKVVVKWYNEKEEKKKRKKQGRWNT